MISSEKVCEEMRQWRVDHRGMAVEQRKHRLFPNFSPFFQRDVVHLVLLVGSFVVVFLL